MAIYFFIAVICILLAFGETVANGNPRYRVADLYFYLAIAIGLFLIAGFRECGFDYYNYYDYFKNLNNPHWFTRGLEIGSEPGYSLLNYSLGNYAAIIAIMSLIIIGVQFGFIWRYSRLPILSIVFYLGLFLYPSTMGQYRQALAIGVVLWAIVNSENRVRFFLLIALAMMFHFSGILGILALFIPQRIRSLKFYLILFGAAIVCSITTQVIYMRFLGMLPEYVATKLAHYAAVETTALGLNSAVMLRAFVFFICYYYRDRLLCIPRMGYFLNIYFLSLIIYTALGFAPQVAGRGSIYFSIFEIILIANLIFTQRGWLRYGLFCLFICFSLYRQWGFFKEWGNDYIPYKNWLFDLF